MLYCSFNTYLRERFGERVQKVTLDAGLTCPNRDGTRGFGGCIYCNTRGSGTGAHEAVPDIALQARAGMERLARRYKAGKFIVYFQSFSNTYAPVDQLKKIYDRAVCLPGVVGLSVATRPDCLDREKLALLAGYAGQLEVWLELGLQSMHAATLARINRAHTYQEFLAGFHLARQYPLKLCLHMIIGLPGEGKDEVLATAREVARLRPDALKIHSLYIAKGTALERLYDEGGFTPLSQQEYVELACEVLELLPPDMIIQRLTGEPDPKELAAPQWSLRKNQTLKLIEALLKDRGSRQGSLFKS